MNIQKIGNNETVINIHGDSVLFSYEAPVAALINGEYFKTSKKWSATTSKHINRWLLANHATIKDQTFFDNLVELWISTL